MKFTILGFAALTATMLLSGCIGSKYVYAPAENMVVLQSHNDFLFVGPCGSPWNYDDQINILLPETTNRTQTAGPEKFAASQLEAYQSGKLKIDSGSLILNRNRKTVTIDLIFEGYGSGVEHVPVRCKYNGAHHYVEQEPGSGQVTRQWLQDFYRTKGISIYDP
jgi:hypothetical protein